MPWAACGGREIAPRKPAWVRRTDASHAWARLAGLRIARDNLRQVRMPTARLVRVRPPRLPGNAYPGIACTTQLTVFIHFFRYRGTPRADFAWHNRPHPQGL